MPATKAQIGLLALQSMKVVDGDATPEANDTSIIEVAYENVYAKLNARNLVSWAVDGSVPNEFIDAVVALTAASRLTFFSPPIDVKELILSSANSAVEDITEMSALDHVPVETYAEYF